MAGWGRFDSLIHEYLNGRKRRAAVDGDGQVVPKNVAGSDQDWPVE
jgi:hypothetical protein